MSELSNETDPMPLDVEVYLRLEPEPDALRCEILADQPAAAQQVLVDDHSELVMVHEVPTVARFTLVAPRQSPTRRGDRAGQVAPQTMRRLVTWIAAVLREVIGTEQAAVLALDGRSGVHWLISSLPDGSPGGAPTSKVLGMRQSVLQLSEPGLSTLAGHIWRALTES